MWRKAIALLFLSSVARAAPLPCSPVFIAGPQGRPLPGAVVSVVNTDSTPIASGVWANSAGTVVFNGQMPVDQILQVFIEAGIYQATVTSSGVTKTYDIVCGDGLSSSVKRVSISRTAEVLLNTIPPAPTLFCLPTGEPCFLAFADGLDMSVLFDFVAPSFPTDFVNILLTVRAAVGGTIVWSLDYCAYGEGDPVCVPTGAHIQTFPMVAGMTVRSDLLVTSAQWSVQWNPSDHVVIKATRKGTDGLDTAGTPRLENIRMELTK